MSKTSRIILWCVMAAVLALCVVLYISTKQTATDTTARDAGKRYAESLQTAMRHRSSRAGTSRSQRTRLKTCARKTAPPA